MTSTIAPKISLVTEAFNLAEGQSAEAFVRALQTVETIAAAQNNVEVIAVDPTHDNMAASIISDRYPHIRSLHLPGKPTMDRRTQRLRRHKVSSWYSWMAIACPNEKHGLRI